MTVQELVSRMPLKVKKIHGKFLAFSPELKEIKAEGDTEEEALDKARKVALVKLQPLSAPDSSSFFERKTAAQLAKEQGIKPLDDLSKISGGWEDVDMDEFSSFIHELRGRHPHDREIYSK